MNTDFTLNMSQAEFGYIWGLLNTKPSGESRTLMNKLEAQAGSQIQAYEDSQRAIQEQLAAKAQAERDAAIASAAATLINEQAARAATALGPAQGFVAPASAPTAIAGAVPDATSQSAATGA